MVVGTSSLGNLYSVKAYSDKLQLIQTVLDCFPKLAVFDSAGKYGAGLALESLGKALRELKVPKDRVLICNKLGWRRIPLQGAPTFEKDIWKDLSFDAKLDISYQGIIDCFEEGNALLGPYESQLVSVHDPDEYLAKASGINDYNRRLDDIVEAYRALSDLKKAGRVLAVGVGAKSWEVIQKIYSRIALDWVMFANSMTIYHHPPRLLRFMQQLEQDGVGIINSAVFHSGFLVGGAYFDYQLASAHDRAFQRQHKWRANFFDICKAMDVEPAHACIQYGLNLPGVNALALNSTSSHRIKRNLDYCQTSIKEEFWARLAEEQLIQRVSNISI